MNTQVVITGTIFLIIGLSLFIFRLKIYPDRVSGKRKGREAPGIPPGTIEDKIWFLGPPLFLCLFAILWISKGFSP